MARSKKFIPTEILRPRADFCHRFTLACHISLIALLAIWMFVIAPPEKASSLVSFLVLALPLILFIPALRKRHPRTYAWLCFFILFYFCMGSMYAFLLPTTLGILALLESILSIAIFIGAMMCTRWYGMLSNRTDEGINTQEHPC